VRCAGGVFEKCATRPWPQTNFISLLGDALIPSAVCFEGDEPENWKFGKDAFDYAQHCPGQYIYGWPELFLLLVTFFYNTDRTLQK
jgi:hypothetical protein